MSNIEVGEYVKDTYGVIGKVKKIVFDDEALEEYCYFEKTFMGTYTKDIVNHSKNIIDLIEVGDIVEIQKGLYDIQKIIIENEETLISVQESLKNYAVLKSIVTKEMYESIEYRVGE